MARWIQPDDEPAAVRALVADYDRENRDLFCGLLRFPVIELADQSLLGMWRPADRTIRLQREFVCSAPWLETVGLLRHEMAHQFVEEVLNVRNQPPHGPAFRQVCADRGIDAAAAGGFESAPGPAAVSRRIEKLLRLAESAEQNEAEAAMRRAQALLRAHNLDIIRSHTERLFRFRQLGTTLTRIETFHRVACRVLIQHFFVKIIFVPAFVPGRRERGSAVEAIGAPENLDVAEFVWGFLIATAERLWRAHRQATGVSGHDRRRYLAGVMHGFLDKLNAGVQESSAEERALVKSGDPALEAHYDKRYPRRRTVTRRGLADDASLQAGREAGRSIVLSKPVRGGDGQGGGLLGPGS